MKIPACSSLHRFRLPAFVRAVALLVLLPLGARAQLTWSVYNETTTTAAPASDANSGVTVTVPAGQRVTLIANNFVPVDFSGGSTAQVYATINFKASGGLSGISGGTRAVGFGLYNNSGTAANFADDNGYFTWLNGRNTGSLIELRRRNGDGTSTSLLNPSTATAWNSLGTGTTTQKVGALSDGNSYSIQLHLMGRNPGVSLGNTSSTTSGAGVWVSDGQPTSQTAISQTAYTNPDNPPSTYVFNEVGFMFYNSTNADVTLTINSVTGLTAINPPVVTTPPPVISVNPGQAATLTVGVTGTAPLTYQWTKGGTAIVGATAATYTIPSAATTDAGSYAVTITNAYGTATSSAAALTVTSATIPATLISQPTGLTVNAGQNAAFSVTAYGSSPVSYQWKKEGTAITGATSASLTITGVAVTDAGGYAVTVSNSAATVTSSAAVLAVNTLPTITTQPVNATVFAGQDATFSVVASGSPAPTYQWKRNGVNIAGATASSYTVSGSKLTDTGVYTVTLTNSVGAVTSAPAVLAIPSTMGATAVSPGVGATGINTDTLLSITFDRVPVIGNAGRIRIYKASDNTLVDTLDLGVTPYTRSIGTQTVNYIFYPIIVTGNTATIFPHAGILAYGQKYYVTMEPSVIQDSTGASYGGFSSPTAWTFTTKANGPAAGTTAVTVSADGSADFNTVQGAIDFVPNPNTAPFVITVKKGVYTEMNYIGATKPFITVQGENRAATIIQYADNNNFNTLTGNNRAMFSCDASDFTLQTITLHNLTPQGGSQAEAFRGNGLRILLSQVNLLSLQDTFLLNGNNCSAFVTDSYIEGNTDFMWGSGAVYMQRTELKALTTGTATEGYYTQMRNGQTQVGAVYVDCRLTAAPGVIGKSTYYLGRIDPTPGNFPFSQCIWVNCAMDAHISPAGWQLNNATSSTTVQDWEYKSTDLTGALLDVSKRISSSRQLSDTEGAYWRNPVNVLGGWVPQVAANVPAPSGSVAVVSGATASLTTTANGALQWVKNGVAVAGATAPTLIVPNAQPAQAGLYRVIVTPTGQTASVVSPLAILGITSTSKVIGSGTEVGPNIFVAANGVTYDQVLLQGTAATVTADPGQVVRLSYVDLTDDIVQVEFSGAGSLTLTLDNATGPAPAKNYNQPSVSYMKGQASIVITGANETSNLAVYSLGNLTAVDQTVLRTDVTYDGMADISYVAIASTNGKFGGVRTANAHYFNTTGVAGLYAPGVQFVGPVYISDINAFNSATPMLVVGSASDVRITGGALLQANGSNVQVDGLIQVQLTAGTTSKGTVLPVQPLRGRFERNGLDVTAQIVPGS